MKVHLVDGTFELFRCFHGAPRATTADGHEVGAARAFLWTMLKLIRKDGATHVAVAFDAMTGRSRPGAGADAGELIRSQYLPASDGVRALGLTLWPMYRFQPTTRWPRAHIASSTRPGWIRSCSVRPTGICSSASMAIASSSGIVSTTA